MAEGEDSDNSVKKSSGDETANGDKKSPSEKKEEAGGGSEKKADANRVNPGQEQENTGGEGNNKDETSKVNNGDKKEGGQNSDGNTNQVKLDNMNFNFPGKKKTQVDITDVVAIDIKEKKPIVDLDTVRVKFADNDVQVVSVNIRSDQSLSKLRTWLKGVIDSSDRFLLDGAAVTFDSEYKIEIRHALDKDGTVGVKRKTAGGELLKASDAEVSAVKRRDTSTGKYDLEARQLNASRSSREDSYSQLSNDDRKTLIENCGATRGILMQGDKIEWSRNPFIIGKDISLEDFEAYNPQENYQSNQFVSSSRKDIERQSNWGVAASVKASGFGVSGEASGSYSRSDAETTSDSTVFSSTELMIPKVEITLRNPKLNGTCASALKLFEERTGEFWEDFVTLREFFRTWGAYVPITTVIGGKLVMRDEKVLKSSDSVTSWAASARASFNARVAAGSVAAEGGATEGKTTSDQSFSGLLTATGGDPGVAQSPGEWAASLGSWHYWKPCRISDYTPIYAFASDAAKAGIYKTLWFWHDLWRNDPMMIDLDHYLFTLARELSPIKLPDTPIERSGQLRASVRSPAVATFDRGSYLFAERGGKLHCILLCGNEAIELLDGPLSSLSNLERAKAEKNRTKEEQRRREENEKRTEELKEKILNSPMGSSARIGYAGDLQRHTEYLKELALTYENSKAEREAVKRDIYQKAFDVLSAPIAFSNRDGTTVIVMFASGASRDLLCLRLTFKQVGEYDSGKRRFEKIETISGPGKYNIGQIIGDPVVLPYPASDGNTAFGAVRNDDAIHVFRIRDGEISSIRNGQCKPSRRRFYGQFSGFVDKDEIVNLFVPTTPVENFHMMVRTNENTGWQNRTLPKAHASGSLAAIETGKKEHKSEDSTQQFHVFVPGGSKLLYLHGLHKWDQLEIASGMRRPVTFELGDRITVLGRVGQQLHSFSIDLDTFKEGDVYKFKVDKVVKPLFASGITGDPVMFEARSPDGERSVSAVVPHETDKLLWLWYDHGKDEWTMLPP
tara:strand:- start:1213 stop:4263 length:3051 start_codon:yes stop_codon:yes gene_type:complete